jgi:murein DD-endopeptidase MepM/ murein hydrolase activator NlpD
MTLSGTRFSPEKNTSRKRRKRGFPLIRLLGGCIVLFFVGKQLFRPGVPESSLETGGIQHAAVLPELEIPLSKVSTPLQRHLTSEKISSTHVVKSGDSFFGILSGFDLQGDESSLIIQAFKKFDATTLFPGDSIVLRRNSDSTFSSIDFYRGSLNKYAVINRDSVVVARKELLPVTGYTYLLNGSLETSLSEAMYQQGVSDVITAGIADIFAWDINFFIDPRKGDTFQVLFEREVINGKLCGYGAIRAAKYTLSNQKQFFAFGLRDSAGNMHYFDENGKALQKQFLKAPLRFSRVSSKFTYRRKHPILGIARPHLGVDYAAPYGTPVHAAADGKVQFAGRKSDYGNLVILSHGGVYQTYYGHLQNFGRGIRTGRYVRQGDDIGNVGATGLATGPHLDYRMKKNGSFVNPMTFSSPPSQSVPDDQIVEFAAAKQYYRALFEKRFSGRSGCFLVDIALPDPEDPQEIVMKKPSQQNRIN